MRAERHTPPLEDVLSSRGRVKVLKVLAEIGELYVSEISRRTGLNNTVTTRHLTSLAKIGLISEKRFGKIRIFQFQDLDPRAQAIKKLIDFWESERSS